ncbi:iron-containing alcohol dehydrogenase [Desulfonatronum thioautotrophicum]|uniref:iron-containing alcohol dehydrogenase n=1 Tax=Desulfonatronum thioautotrophicum TaxID=617001 RepID=UPI0005EB97AD|nr:iron-containing alcohol dehydrogenase [Desulfonatronum thioautotrophicum]
MSEPRVTKFAIPEIIFGQGSIRYLAQCSRRLGAKRALVVTDQGLIDSGWADHVMDILRDDGLDFLLFDKVNSNPRDYQVHEGADLYVREKADVIIALGGGSPMDSAKGIGTIVGNGGRIADYEGANRIMRPLPPMIFIPTNAGSGSDISQFCIITDVGRQVKMSIISRSLVPNVSIIDPDLLMTKDDQLVVSSAIDALAHAIESFVSPLASPFTENQALKAIELIAQNLQPAILNRTPQVMEQLSIASTAAGMSFSNAGLGIGHALAHSLGGIFDTLHGLVHPIVLPVVMRYNLPVCREKMCTIGRIIQGSPGGCTLDHGEEGIIRLEELFAKLEVPNRMRDIVPDSGKLEQICRMAVHDACMLTNPRKADWEDLLHICQEAW